MSSRFSVGDKIIIKSVEEIKNIAKKEKMQYIYHHVSSMRQYSNFCATITNIDRDGYLSIDITGSDYKWHHTWIKWRYLFTDEDFLI